MSNPTPPLFLYEPTTWTVLEEDYPVFNGVLEEDYFFSIRFHVSVKNDTRDKRPSEA